jgi:hypothetical protein
MGVVKHSCVLIKTNKSSSHKNKHYHPAVIYEYEVKNIKYTNNKIGNYLGFGNDEEFASELISHYPEGARAKVYYWPAFPKVSFLSPGMKQILANYILLFTGVILILGSFSTLFTNNPSWFIEKIFGIIDYVT